MQFVFPNFFLRRGVYVSPLSLLDRLGEGEDGLSFVRGDPEVHGLSFVRLYAVGARRLSTGPYRLCS